MDEFDRGVYRGRIVILAVFVAAIGGLTMWLFTGPSHPRATSPPAAGSVSPPSVPLAVTGAQVDTDSVATGAPTAPTGMLSPYPGAPTTLMSPGAAPPSVGAVGGEATAPGAQSPPMPGTVASVGSAPGPVTPPAVATTPPAASSPVGSPATLGWCADATTDVMARSGAPSYRMGSPARFELIVVSLASDPCRRDVGRSLRELTVTAVNGTRLWSSLDCSFDTRPDVRVLSPGSAVTFSLLWVGRTSHPGCSGARVPVGPGTYRVTARLGTRVGGSTGLIIQP